jgi:hypothetical protein
VRRALGLTLLLTLALPLPANAQNEREAFLIIADDMSYEAFIRLPDVRSLASSGGLGLMTTPGGDDEPPRAIESLIPSPVGPGLIVLRDESVSVMVDELRTNLEASSASEVLVIFAVASASERMREQGDNVTPVLVATGHPAELFSPGDVKRGLTSDTTRRDGVVANMDVPATIRSFFGSPEPEVGSPIRVQGEAPTELHERYLDYKRVVVPTGVVVLLITLAALAMALVLLFVRGASPPLIRAVAIWGVLGISLQVALLPGSWLPSYEPAVVALAVGGIGVVVAAAALWLGRGSAVKVPAAVAGIGFGFVVLDGLLVWPSGLTPLLGGSALDGVRFYGLGNSYAGGLLAGGVLVAALLPPLAGLTLLLLSALFAGLPFLGADLGGGVTMFAVAGLWYGLRIRRSAGWAFAAAAVGAIAGAVLLVVAHRFLPPEPTHVTRAVEDSGGLAGLVDVFLDRLRLNLEVTVATPAIWPALAGIPVALWVALTQPRPFRSSLDRFDAWRLGAITLAIGGMLGYVLNDTYGMASVTFIYLALALVYPALAERWTSD